MRFDLRKLLVAAAFIGLGIIAVRYWPPRRERPTEAEPEREFDFIDEASEQSFPASDAPSWTPRV